MWIRQGLTAAIARPSLRNQRPVRRWGGTLSNSLMAPSSGTQSRIRTEVAVQIQADRRKRVMWNGSAVQILTPCTAGSNGKGEKSAETSLGAAGGAPWAGGCATGVRRPPTAAPERFASDRQRRCNRAASLPTGRLVPLRVRPPRALQLEPVDGGTCGKGCHGLHREHAQCLSRSPREPFQRKVRHDRYLSSHEKLPEMSRGSLVGFMHDAEYRKVTQHQSQGAYGHGDWEQRARLLHR